MSSRGSVLYRMHIKSDDAFDRGNIHHPSDNQVLLQYAHARSQQIQKNVEATPRLKKALIDYEAHKFKHDSPRSEYLQITRPIQTTDPIIAKVLDGGDESGSEPSFLLACAFS